MNKFYSFITFRLQNTAVIYIVSMCIAVTVYFKFLDINNIKAMKAVIAKTEEVIQIQLSNKYTANAANKF